MNVTHENYGNVCVISLKGEFTADDVETFSRAVKERLARDARDFVIDLEKSPFVDSAALERLLDLRDEVREKLGMVKLAGPDANVSKVLEMTRLDQQFETYGELIEAVKSFR